MNSILSSGASISHYRILTRLGAGGMGEVYEAHDSQLERPVALKILPPELVRNEDRVRRFMQEAKSASALSHPHIVTIYEIGESEVRSGDGGDGPSAPIHFIAMELIRGETLGEKIRAGEVEPRDLVRWMSQAAEGLAKAHAAGIIHRDLKPENIMITRDGYAKVLDFGLAKLTEPLGQATTAPTALREGTREGVILGTAGYMSPEQVQGKPVDHRSDIFSFGCVLYEAAAGRKPFEGETSVDTMHQILHAQPPSVKEIAPTVPPELRRIIRRCMAKDPEKRYQSMKDVAIELGEVVEDWDELVSEGISRSSGSGESVPLGMPRRGLGIGIALAAMIVLLAGILLLRGRRPVERTRAVQPTFTQLTDFAGEELQPSISPDGDTLAYVGSGTGNSDIYLLRVGGQNPINLTEASKDDDYQPSFSPDGALIAFRSEREGGGIFLMGATGESARRLSDFGYSPSWSPDGKQIVVCSEKNLDPWNRFPPSSLWLIDVATGQRRKIHDGDAVHPQWSPKGNRIAFWGLPRHSGERDIGSIAAAGGDLQWVTTDPAFDWNPVWSADGSYLYFTSDRGGSMNLWRVPMDPATGRSLGDPEAVTSPSRHVSGVAMPREGKKIVFVSSDYRSNIQRLAFDPDRERIAGGPYPVTRGTVESGMCSLSADGQWLVYTTYRGQEDLFVIKADGTGIRRLTNDPYKDRGPSWSPDGNRIAFYSDRSGNYEIWSINRDGSGLQQLTTTSGGTTWFFPRWSPDGLRLAASESTSAAIFALAGGAASAPEILPKLEGGRFFVTDWSPDGKKLIGGRTVTPTIIDALILYDLPSRRYSVIDAFGPTPFVSASWIDNRRVIYNGATSLKLVDLTTGKGKVIYQTESGRLGNATVSRDGRTIAFTVRTTEADLWLATLQ